MRLSHFPYSLIYCCRRLARGTFVNDAVNVLHFIDDPCRDFLKDIPRNSRPVLVCHAVNRCHGANADRIVISSCVSHDADAADIRKNGEVLPNSLSRSALRFLRGGSR